MADVARVEQAALLVGADRQGFDRITPLVAADHKFLTRLQRVGHQ